MKTIVVGLDGTPKDEGVADWVARLTDDLPAHIIAVHIIPSATPLDDRRRAGRLGQVSRRAA
jgi:hypothetical protein